MVVMCVFWMARTQEWLKLLELGSSLLMYDKINFINPCFSILFRYWIFILTAMTAQMLMLHATLNRFIHLNSEGSREWLFWLHLGKSMRDKLIRYDPC